MSSTCNTLHVYCTYIQSRVVKFWNFYWHFVANLIKPRQTSKSRIISWAESPDFEVERGYSQGKCKSYLILRTSHTVQIWISQNTNFFQTNFESILLVVFNCLNMFLYDKLNDDSTHTPRRLILLWTNCLLINYYFKAYKQMAMLFLTRHARFPKLYNKIIFVN